MSYAINNKDGSKFLDIFESVPCSIPGYYNFSYLSKKIGYVDSSLYMGHFRYKHRRSKREYPSMETLWHTENKYLRKIKLERIINYE